MKMLYCAAMAGALFVFAGKAYATPTVPEIDAGSAVTALGLLGGFIALAAERFRRK